MRQTNFLFTSESVTEGHPDKIADQISDGILDAIIAKDKNCRVACETILTTGIAFVAGEISTRAYVEIPEIIRETIREVGYTDATWGFDYSTCSVLTAIHNQSGDIAMGVDSGGAGDQGLMFGYASNETPELMPMPIILAHRLTRRLAEVRKKNILPWVRPDGKSQVTVEYKNGKPVRIDTIVLSTQHSDAVTSKKIEKDVMEKVDADLNTTMISYLSNAQTYCEAIPNPFDYAIMSEVVGGSGPIMTAILQLQSNGNKLAEVAHALGITISTELPE